MLFRKAAARSLAVSAWVLLLASPAAAIGREKLQALFAAPYSVGARDGALPIWPIFKTTSSGDELIAYVFEFTDFEPAPDQRDTGVDRLVAVRPSGAFLEVQVIGAERSPFLNWFGRNPSFEFIRRDQAGALMREAGVGSSASQNAIELSRQQLRALLSIAVEAPGNPVQHAIQFIHEASASTRIALAALAVSIILFLATLFRCRAPALSPTRGKRQGESADRSPPSLESDL
jgi:hypothetical protein